jgi:hypothetical protein
MTKMRLAKTLFLALLAGCVSLGVVPANAEIVGYDYHGFHLGAGLTAALGTFHADNSNFGAAATTVDGDKDHSWFEAYIMPNVNWSYNTGRFGMLYGEFAYVGTQTLGGIDPIGFSQTFGGSEDPGNWESERLYVGWKSGKLISGLPENVIDVSFGEQEFTIGDGFLIADAEFDGAKGCYWIAPHKSFRKTAILKINTEPVRADLFYLKADKDYADAELYGINVEYIKDDWATIGFNYMKVTNANEFYEDGLTEDFYKNRDGMDVWSVRFQGTPLAPWGLEELFLAGEYAQESGGDRADVDAYGYYAEAGWTFSHLPWTPTLSYRYAFFSGDDPDSSDYEAFDPLFYGFLRGWGTHFMGEVTGEYYLFNSNQHVNMVHLNAVPTDKLSLGAIYYNFQLDKADSYGVSDDDFTNEINVYADYALSDNVWLSGVAAIAFPGEGAEEIFGDDQAMMVLEAYIYFYF